MKYIAYYRVSTTRQGQSGLGLEAQQQAVSNYLGTQEYDLIDEHIEIESGKRNDRPELQNAIATCKKLKATLIIAKLDRLARNVHFISGLMESGIEFVAVDNPHANRLMLHMLAAFAEHEREQISIRTKAALAAAKRRGVRLGVNGIALAKKHRDEAFEFAQKLGPAINQICEAGAVTYQEIAAELNNRGIKTRDGGKWYPMTASRALKRLEIAPNRPSNAPTRA